MRIQKHLSEKGILSRRKTEEYMLAGKISVNGEVVKDLGRQIDPKKDKVEIEGGEGRILNKNHTVLIYKPRGIVSSRIEREGETIYKLFPQYKHLHIAGRLDKESEGLLLLTNDGVLAKKITGPKHEIEKEYRVHVRENVEPRQLEAMERGIKLDDGITLPAKTSKISKHEFTIILREGKNHQIRRMCDAMKLTVVRLIRVRIGNLNIGKLKAGEMRVVEANEVASLKKL